MGNKVSLCMICKNEASNIGDLIEDVCPVIEDVIIVDTGSTDDTLSILEDKKEKYPNLRVEHYAWNDNFSDARNYSFELADKTTDWYFWLDGDDRVDQVALADFKDRIIDDPKIDAWLLPYIYSKHADGSPNILLTRERFIRKEANPRWAGAIHETIGVHHLRNGDYNLPIEHNHKNKVIDPLRNLKILKTEFDKNDKDNRTVFYYAKELFDHIDPKAKDLLIYYLSLPHKYWDEEIAARFRLAKIYLSENNYGEAIRTIEPVYHLDSTRRRSEFYYIYGEVERLLRNYDIAIDWYQRCLYPAPGSPRVVNLEYWTWNPLKRIAECYVCLGNWPKVWEYIERVKLKLPNDPSIARWVRELKSHKLLPKGNHKLITLEFNTELRYDSYRAQTSMFHVENEKGETLVVNWKLDPRLELPFDDNSIDGIIIENSSKTHYIEIHRILKPGGFLWSTKAIPDEYLYHYFNNLGANDYQQQNIHNYIKVDTNKPVIGYEQNYPSNGPYRYRIHNLILSASKQGYKCLPINAMVINEPIDVFISMKLNKKYGKVNVMEICEKLDGYDECSIELADVLNCSSPLLAEHLQTLYPNKIVINVDDHFEIPTLGWL